MAPSDDIDSQHDRIRDTEPTVSIIAAVKFQAGGMLNSGQYSYLLVDNLS